MKKIKYLFVFLGILMVFGTVQYHAQENLFQVSINEEELKDVYYGEQCLNISVDENKKQLYVLEVENEKEIKQYSNWITKEDKAYIDLMLNEQQTYKIKLYESEKEVFNKEIIIFNKDKRPVITVGTKEVYEIPNKMKKETITFCWNQEEIFVDSLEVKVIQQNKEQIIDTKKDNNKIEFVLEDGIYDCLYVSGIYKDQTYTLLKWKDIKVCTNDLEISMMDGSNKLEPGNHILNQVSKLNLTVLSKELDLNESYIMVNDLKKQDWLIGNTTNMSIMLDASKVNQIKCYVKDVYGNKHIENWVIFIDDQHPEINYLINDREYTSESTYFSNKPIQVKINIKDANIKEENLEVYDFKQVVKCDWQKNDTGYETILTLDSNSHEIKIIAMDEGKRKTVKKLPLLVVDEKRPQVILKSDTSEQEGYGNKKTYTIRIEEEFPDKNHWKIQSSLNGTIQEHASIKKEDNNIYQYELSFEEEGNYELFFDLQDEAGNIAEYRWETGEIIDNPNFKFYIDKTCPLLFITFDQNEVYKNKNQMMQMKLVEEHPFDESIQLSYEDEIKDISIKEEIYEISKDGIYKIYNEIYDTVGNHAKLIVNEIEIESNMYEFILDKQKPVLKVLSDLSIENQSKHVNIRIEDINLDSYQVFLFQDKKLIELEEGIENNTIELILDGETNKEQKYTIKAVVKDKAGNYLEYESDPIWVDRKNPEIKLSLNERDYRKDSFITNKDVHLNIQYEDQFIKDCKIKLLKNKDIIYEQEIETNFNYVLKTEENKEDSYEVLIEAKDQANNIEIKQLNLVLDTYLPSLEFTQSFKNEMVINDSFKLELKQEKEAFYVMQFFLYRNGKLILHPWGMPITKEGIYRMDVIIQDDATNQAKLENLTFTIDKSNPDIYILDAETMEEAKTDSQGETFIIYSDDNYSNSNLTSVKVNGEEKIEQLKEEKLILKRTTNEMVEVYANAMDEAGNTSETTLKLLSKTKPKQLSPVEVNQENEPKKELKYSYLLGTGLIVILLVYIRRKKK